LRCTTDLGHPPKNSFIIVLIHFSNTEGAQHFLGHQYHAVARAPASTKAMVRRTSMCGCICRSCMFIGLKGLF
jgi:hypothetical protein